MISGRQGSVLQQTNVVYIVVAGLEDLDMTGCTGLTSLPHDLGNLLSLTRLELASCSSLASVPQSIAQLQHLRVLNLRDCQQLTALPAELLAAITGCNDPRPWDAEQRDATHSLEFHRRPSSPSLADQQYQTAGAQVRSSRSGSATATQRAWQVGGQLKGRDTLKTRGTISSHDAGVSSPNRGPDEGMDETVEYSSPSLKYWRQQGSPSSAATSAENPARSGSLADPDAALSPSVPGRSSDDSCRSPVCNSPTQDDVINGGQNTTHVIMPHLLFLVTSGCLRLQRPRALAAATAELACRMMALRFASGPAANCQADRNTWAAAWAGNRAQGLPKHLMPQWSEETLACQRLTQ